MNMIESLTAELAALRAERDALNTEVAKLNVALEVLGKHHRSTIDSRNQYAKNAAELCVAQNELAGNLTVLRDRAERAESDAAESKRRCGELEHHLTAMLDGDICTHEVRGYYCRVCDGCDADMVHCPKHEEWCPVLKAHEAVHTAALTPEASK